MSLKLLDFAFRIQPKNVNWVTSAFTGKPHGQIYTKVLPLDFSAQDYIKQPCLYNFHIPAERKFFSCYMKDKRRANQLLQSFNIDLNKHIIQDARDVKTYTRLFCEQDHLPIKFTKVNFKSALGAKFSKNGVTETNKLNLSIQGMKILESYLLQLIYRQNVFDNLLSLKDLEIKYRFNMKKDIITILEARLETLKLLPTIFDIKKELLPIEYTREKNLQTLLALFGYLAYHANKNTMSDIIMQTFEKDFILMNEKFLSSY
ncbi:hypothetical protein QEN19_002679 [Hanseniaspora menglaensis]